MVKLKFLKTLEEKTGKIILTEVKNNFLGLKKISINFIKI